MTADWVADLVGSPLPDEGRVLSRGDRQFKMSGGILRDLAVVDPEQAQTRDAFAYKWKQRATYDSPAMRSAIGTWLHQRYAGLISELKAAKDRPRLLLDAGCGAGNAASLLLGEVWPNIKYVGADISTAVDLARETIQPVAPESFFIQSDLMALPFGEGTFDVVLSEGVLHHTPSTKEAIGATARLVKPGGIYAIYVYAKKSPAREFTDDHIRGLVSNLSSEEAWERLMPLTKLGKALGDLDVYVDVPEDVEVLGIPKGRINVQRLFYWHFCKMFHRPDLSLDEMNHINFDWFTPKYSHRQTPEEVASWCGQAGLAVEHLHTEEAGITVIARRAAA